MSAGEIRILILAGSNRSGPGVASKARALAERMAARLPRDFAIDTEDLGNAIGRSRIQSCNGCASTSMALCCWPCNCYRPNDPAAADLLWDVDLYARLDLADAWAIIGPIYWNAPSSNLKLLFDRLICMNGGNPRPDRIDGKSVALARQLERSPEWASLSRNHLEGRTAGFLCYGHEWGEELDPSGRPRMLRHPEYLDPSQDPWADTRDAYAPLVWQCRFSGIEVPDGLWRYVELGRGKRHSDNQVEQLAGDTAALGEFDAWTDRFAAFVRAKGKVQPGDYRAFGRRAGARADSYEKE